MLHSIVPGARHDAVPTPFVRVGRREGQTLVVDVTGFSGTAWFDRAGNFQSESLHVVERFTPIDALPAGAREDEALALSAVPGPRQVFRDRDDEQRLKGNAAGDQ
jgi:hypothetical protein